VIVIFIIDKFTSQSSPCESQTTSNINYIYLCIVLFLNLFWFIFDSIQLSSELCHMFLIHDWLWYQTLRKKHRHSKKFIHQLQHEIFRSFNTFMQECSYQLYAWMKDTDICSILIWKVLVHLFLDKCHSNIKHLTCLVWWQKLIKYNTLHNTQILLNIKPLKRPPLPKYCDLNTFFILISIQCTNLKKSAAINLYIYIR
jgi:hypothetical protein